MTSPVTAGTATDAAATSFARAGHPAPLFTPCDVRDIPALQTAIASSASALGAITILVNNAASDTRHRVDEVDLELWDDQMAVDAEDGIWIALWGGGAVRRYDAQGRSRELPTSVMQAGAH